MMSGLGMMSASARTFRFRLLVLWCSVLFAAPASADYIVELDTWNESNIQDSGDLVEVLVAEYGGNTALTFQWQEADTGDDLWTAIGLDTIYYNAEALVLMALDQDGNDVTSNWNLNFGGTNAAGFGSFLSRQNLDGGGTGGIDPESVTFVLDRMVELSPNSVGANFAAHVRYGDGCSGWVSDGQLKGNATDSGTCGATQVPEPGTLFLFGMGLAAIGLSRRREKL
jgi:hypothetical protein